MNQIENSHEAVPSAPQTETEVKKRAPIFTDSKLVEIESKIDKSAGPEACWPWMGAVGYYGYGQITMPTTSERKWCYGTHRLVFILKNGPIPAGLEVMHSCDNPLCCNLAHLSLGTTEDNLRDKIAKGRQSKGDNHGMRKLRAHYIPEIRAKHANGIRMLDLAVEYDMTYQAITRIVKRITWRDVL